MAHNSSPYIDGNRGQAFRTVNGAGTFVDPHTNVIAPHDSYVHFDGDYKALKTESKDYVSYNFTSTVTTGINYLPEGGFDCRKLRLLHLKIISTGVTLTDFVTAVTVDASEDIWDDIANADFHYTTGQGENTGNSLVLVRKCSPINPRTLGSGVRTWIIYNVEPYSHIYTRCVASTPGTLKYYVYGLYN